MAPTHLLIHLILGAPLQVPLHLAVRRRLAQGEILIPIVPLRGKTRGMLLPRGTQRGRRRERKRERRRERKRDRRGEAPYLREARPSAALPLGHFSHRL